jgi:hypothetical protein
MLGIEGTVDDQSGLGARPGDQADNGFVPGAATFNGWPRLTVNDFKNVEQLTFRKL